jgi:hypothetical protein
VKRENKPDRFTDSVVAALDSAKIIGVRSGDEHRFTGVWVVVVKGRVYSRSWNDKLTGWFRAFKNQPKGTIQAGDLGIPVHAKMVRGPRVLDAVTQALAKKYDTKGSQKWVKGFAEPKRVRNTVEFVPSK